MVLFSFYVEVFVENACVCITLIEPTYVVVLSIWLFAVFTVIYAVRLIIAFVDVNKTYLILHSKIKNKTGQQSERWAQSAQHGLSVV